MSYSFPPDVAKLVHEQMIHGGFNSEDDLLRCALKVLGQFEHSAEDHNEEYRQTVSAVREGVADMEAGRMRPLNEIIQEANKQ